MGSRMTLIVQCDHIAWIHDRTHERTITEYNGRDALALAVEATRILQ